MHLNDLAGASDNSRKGRVSVEVWRVVSAIPFLKIIVKMKPGDYRSVSPMPVLVKLAETVIIELLST